LYTAEGEMKADQVLTKCPSKYQAEQAEEAIKGRDELKKGALDPVTKKAEEKTTGKKVAEKQPEQSKPVMEKAEKATKKDMPKNS